MHVWSNQIYSSTRGYSPLRIGDGRSDGKHREKWRFRSLVFGADPKCVPVTKMRGPLLERGAGIEVTVGNPVEAAG